MSTNIYIQTAVIIFIFMCYIFFLAQVFKNNSIVDVFWGIGFIVIVAFFNMTADSFIGKIIVFTSKDVVNFFTIIWGLRLAIHIYIKNKGQDEDWRYINFRRNWTKKNIPHWLGAFFQVFMLQGVFMFIIALPIIHVNQYYTPVSYLTYFGIVIWVIGFFFEAVGDYQKSKFKQDLKNKDKILTAGLWKYTRHPNYFGETLMSWAIFIIAVNFFHPVTTFINILSPITLTWLLTRVSGVPLLESKYKNNEAYQQYIKNTPSFFPKFW